MTTKIKLGSAKAVVRALIRAMTNLQNDIAYAAHMDAQFDGGEFSGSFHSPSAYVENIIAILEQLGITERQAFDALNAWCALDKTPPTPWGGGDTPAAYYVAAFISEATFTGVVDEYEFDSVHGRGVNA